MRPLLFCWFAMLAGAALAVGAACDSRPAVPIDDEEDAGTDADAESDTTLPAPPAELG